MRVKLMHRNAHGSPFRKRNETRLESLRSLLLHDRLRLGVFSDSIRSTVRDESADAEAPYGESEGRSIRAPMFSGSFVGSGQYFVDLHIGTPPKRFLLIADTGSDLVWVNCRIRGKQPRFNSSAAAAAAARVLDAAASSTFSPVSCAAEECQLVPAPPLAPCSARHPTSCKYMYTYADRSESRGVFASETLTINATSAAAGGAVGGGIRIPSVAMGCSTRHSGQSFDRADGVVGLGQGPISFPSQIGYMYGDTFSYCLVDPPQLAGEELQLPRLRPPQPGFPSAIHTLGEKSSGGAGHILLRRRRGRQRKWNPAPHPAERLAGQSRW
ncbi:hypothetical protein KI387_002388 [Taxus chinensis]|uniref:Peptidase A1 domain-containing protein n=1 Tax=Taxus chinensis TaxID=29808 RepID=A0AA38GZD1_TAXCH|nr:hypothetical protein KI387_002388 [Taxus chinensis]